MADSGPTELEEDITIAMLVVFSLIGTIGNSFVIYGFSVVKQKMTSTVFIITLAVIDLVTCIITIPFTIAMEAMHFRLSNIGVCRLFHFLLTTTVPFSAFVMVAIAIDRYFCICRPFKQVLNIRRATIIVICLLVFSLVIGVMSCLNFGIYTVIQEESSSILNSSQIQLQPLNRSGITNPYGYITLEQQMSTDGNVIFLQQNETTQIHVQINKIQYCITTSELFGKYFRSTYQLIYSLFYAVSVVLVIIFYSIIYRFILTRRHRRLRSEQAPCCSVKETTLCDAETTMTDCSPAMHSSDVSGDDVENDSNQNAKCQSTTLLNVKSKLSTQSNLSVSHRQSRQKEDKMRLNNIKTALMLSLVALVFTVAFLPAWLIKHKLIPFNLIVFYLYYIYNVVNPFIYAFMNPHFQQTIISLVRRINSKMRK